MPPEPRRHAVGIAFGGQQMEYWFNTKSGQVQRGDDPDLPRSGDLMGPYDSEQEASRAYEIAAAKTEKWDEEDREDDDWDSNPLNDQS
ncbi:MULTISPECIES: hypothetical protein [unclassified Serinicoccus]|uniref:hypothetical protein n=2 Tax=Serinicoccus TaxID=265976 RepID=UPI001EDB4102|nr:MULTISPECIES: hypothetical protein [unclassified Serinicoccus]